VSSRFTEPLSGWDVIALLVGVCVSFALARLLAHDHAILWLGAPAACLALRRRFLPRPSTTPEWKPAPSLGGRVLGYVLLVLGGLVMLLSGLAARLMFTEGAPLPIAIALCVFGTALWIASLGFRRLT
jgi:hypothetical protein